MNWFTGLWSSSFCFDGARDRASMYLNSLNVYAIYLFIWISWKYCKFGKPTSNNVDTLQPILPHIQLGIFHCSILHFLRRLVKMIVASRPNWLVDSVQWGYRAGTKHFVFNFIPINTFELHVSLFPSPNLSHQALRIRNTISKHWPTQISSISSYRCSGSFDAKHPLFVTFAKD